MPRIEMLLMREIQNFPSVSLTVIQPSLR